MSRRGCACDGPVEENPFGAGVQLFEALATLPPPPLPSNAAAHDAYYWPFGARSQEEYDALEASNGLLQLEPYERAEMQKCMPAIHNLDGRQLEWRLKSYYMTNAYRYAAARMPAWFAVMCRTGAFVPYVPGEEVVRAAAPPSPPLRRAPAAARRRAATGRARNPPPPPVLAAVARAEPDEPDGEEKIDVENMTGDDWDPGASMKRKDEILEAFLRACRDGVFGEAVRDCDVRHDWVTPKGYPLGQLVYNRKAIFGRGDTDAADRRLLDAGFVPASARSPTAHADDAFRRYEPLLLDAATRGLTRWTSVDLNRAVSWLGEHVRKTRASDAADDVYVELAVKLGNLAPKGAKSGNKHYAYWAHRLRDQARAVLAGESPLADDALRRHEPVLRDAVAQARPGLRNLATADVAKAVWWLGDQVKKARASDAAAELARVYLELAVELGDAVPAGTKDARGAIYWAHRFKDEAQAMLEGLADAEDDDEEDAQRPPPRSTKPKKRASAKRPRRDAADADRARAIVESSDDEAVAAEPPDDYKDEPDDDAPVASTRKRARAKKGGTDDATTARPRRDAAEPEDKGDIDVTELTEEDYDPGAPLHEKDRILKAFLRACRDGVFGEAVRDCDVPMNWVSPKGYPLGKHIGNRRRTFGRGVADAAAAQLLDAGFVPVSTRSRVAVDDDAYRRYEPVLRDAAARGLARMTSANLSRAVAWLGRQGQRAYASDVGLKLAVELGDAAPASCIWAKNAAKRASAVLESEDAEDEEDEEDAPLPATRPRRKVVYASDADEDEGEAFVAVGGDGHDSEEEDDYDAPMVPKKRKRAAAARAKPVKKRSGRRR